MPTTLIIPRQSDREVASSLFQIANEMADLLPLELMVQVPFGDLQHITCDPSEIKTGTILGIMFEQNSCVSNELYLRLPKGRSVFAVQRKHGEAFDNAVLHDNWRENLAESQNKSVSTIAVRLLALGRKYLRAAEVEASLSSDHNSAWSKYRNAQSVVLSSLQQTAEQIIVDVANKNADIDKLRAERFEKMEAQLRNELAAERTRLLEEHQRTASELDAREKAHVEKESAFETKEARYVARKKQEEQICQVQDWLKNWNLTKGTTEKRKPIFWSYIAALVITGGMAFYATHHNYRLLNSAQDLAQLQWWNWVALMAKSFFPFAAFMTFMIYFIRWSSSWARQHADEEFMNRSLLIDIGRSSWLLEAVRDAHERDKEIPVDLMKELSRNLFNRSPSSDTELHPQAAADLLLQGLSSLRVKSADGTEVEATRGKS